MGDPTAYVLAFVALQTTLQTIQIGLMRRDVRNSMRPPAPLPLGMRFGERPRAPELREDETPPKHRKR